MAQEGPWVFKPAAGANGREVFIAERGRSAVEAIQGLPSSKEYVMQQHVKASRLVLGGEDLSHKYAPETLPKMKQEDLPYPACLIGREFTAA